MYGEVHQAGDPKVYKSRWHFCCRCGAAQVFLGILFGKAALPRKQSLFDTDLGDTFECAAHHLTFAMVPQAKNSVCVQKRSPKKLQEITFSKPRFRTFFTAVMVALCMTFSSDSRFLQKVQKSSEIHRFRNFSWSECRDSNSRPLEPHSSAIPNFATPGYHIHLLHHVSLITIPHSFLFCKPYFRFFCIFYGSGSRSPTAPPPTPAGYPGTGPHPVLCR